MNGLEYHWVMTIEYVSEHGPGKRTRDGITLVEPGETRADVFERLHQRVCESVPVEDATVLFFDLAPNRMDAA